MAEARHERRLLAVACKPSLGTDLGQPPGWPSHAPRMLGKVHDYSTPTQFSLFLWSTGHETTPSFESDPGFPYKLTGG